MTTAPASLDEWARLARAEYLEIPGLHLTESQFRRLFGLDAKFGAELLHTLVQTGFLRRAHTGGYVRTVN